jgi:hypothetical protein
LRHAVRKAGNSDAGQAFEGDSHVEWLEGSFSDYLEDKKRRLGADAVEPKRVKYRKFTR